MSGFIVSLPPAAKGPSRNAPQLFERPASRNGTLVKYLSVPGMHLNGNQHRSVPRMFRGFREELFQMMGLQRFQGNDGGADPCI